MLFIRRAVGFVLQATLGGRRPGLVHIIRAAAGKSAWVGPILAASSPGRQYSPARFAGPFPDSEAGPRDA